MSSVPPSSPTASTPPIAKQVPAERTYHGDAVDDPYAWLADPKDPEVIAYLEAENAYTEASTAGLAELRSAIFDEIKARTQETDLSVPVRKGNWWRYARTDEGQQYAIHCRRRVARRRDHPADAGGRQAPGRRGGAARRERARGRARRSSRSARCRSARTSGCSPTRPTSPATSGSRCGSRTWRPARCSTTRSPTPTTAAPGRATAQRCSTSPSTRPGGPTGSGGTWSARPPPTTWWSSRRPTRSSGSGSGTSRDERFIEIQHRVQADQRGVAARRGRPGGRFRRRRAPTTGRGVRRRGGRRPAADPAQRRGRELRAGRRAAARRPGYGDAASWTPVIAHRADTRLLSVDAFADYLVLSYRRDGLTGLSVLPASGACPSGRSPSPSRSTRSARARTRSTRRPGSGSATTRW